MGYCIIMAKQPRERSPLMVIFEGKNGSRKVDQIEADGD